MVTSQEVAGQATRRTEPFAVSSFQKDYRNLKNYLNQFTLLPHKTVEILEKLYPGKGNYYANILKEYTISLYKKCAEYAWEKGIIIADTKFEFGLDEQGRVVIGDEMLTPDSSRFWPREGYEAGKGQPSYDKQFVRDWLKQNPDSDYDLPEEVIDKTVAKYKEAYEQLTGEPFEA